MKGILISLLTLFLVFLIGTVLFFNAVPKEKRLLELINTDHSIEDPEFIYESCLLIGRPWTKNNQIEVLENGEEIYDSMVEAINSAERTITFETYEYYGDEAAQRFSEAFSAAAERGVKVHALLDFIGSVNATDEQLEMMEEAGVELIRWRKPSWYQFARFNHRTHRKLLIIDGNIGFTGGANVGDNWLGSVENGAYKDYHYKIRGSLVSELQASFSENWTSASGRLIYGNDYFSIQDSAGNKKMQVSSSHPREGKQKMRKMFIYSMASARDTVRFATAYFYPDQLFLDALQETAERGVTVQILVPGESIDKGFVRHASVNNWRGILESGVEIYEYQPSMYHAKLMIADNRMVSMGSSNLDNRSFRLNDETNVNILSEEFAATMTELYKNDKSEAERYTLKMWENRPYSNRLYGWVTELFGAHL
ncbi:cardiolipin synthase B [Rhodohalobacter sp. SW132]|nr:cardiolipin synthase B [Rhodohalobacter sp. SW132]